MKLIGVQPKKELWKIITKKDDYRPLLLELYVPLKNNLFKVSFITRYDYLDDFQLSPDSYSVDNYIESPVLDNYIERYGCLISMNLANCSEDQFLIRLINLSERGKYSTNLTYEHLLCERINKRGHHIILIGAYGSGKSYKISYIWNKYLSQFPHGDCCSLQKRLFIYIDLEKKNYIDPTEMYHDLYFHFLKLIKDNIANPKDRYREFTQYLDNIIKEHYNKPVYISTLEECKFDYNEPAWFDELPDIRNRFFKRNLLIFMLDYLDWINTRYCNDNSECLYIAFDNIDARPIPIQEEILELIETKVKLGYEDRIGIIMICACRPETIVKSNRRTAILDFMPHIGPTAYEVIIKRLDNYISHIIKNIHNKAFYSSLETDLRGNISPDDYLNNIKLIRKIMNMEHFKELFDRLFVWQIREAIVFSQAIIDIAAKYTNKILKEYMKKSPEYRLERLLYKPWGLTFPKCYVKNIFNTGDIYKHRFAEIRILIYLNSDRDKPLPVKNIYEYLNMFGYSQEDSICLINQLLKKRIIIAQTKEGLEIENYAKGCDEKVSLTDCGKGIYEYFGQFQYVESVMFNVFCDEKYYQDCEIKGETIDPYAYIYMKFLQECKEIEFEELKLVHKNGKLSDYNDKYDNDTITAYLYRNAIETLYIIASSLKKDRKMEIFELITNYISAYNSISYELKEIGICLKQDNELEIKMNFIIEYVKNKGKVKEEKENEEEEEEEEVEEEEN